MYDNRNPRQDRDTSPHDTGLAWKVLSGPSLDAAWVWRMARLFREVFAAADYGQYLFYPSEMQPIAPEAVFGAEAARRGLSLEELDGLDLAALRRPDGEQPLCWQHPEATFERLSAKLVGKGHAVVCVDGRGDLAGMVFGYPATLRAAFAGEEWENKVAYSGWAPPRLRDFTRFRDRIADVVARHAALSAVSGSVHDATPVFVLNCIAVSPGQRSGGLGRALFRRLVDSLPADMAAGRLFLGEVKIGSAWHRSLDPTKVIDVPGALAEGPDDPRLIVSPSQHGYRRPG